MSVFYRQEKLFFLSQKEISFYDSKSKEIAKNISFPQKKFLFYVSKNREKAKNISFPPYFFLPDPKEMEKWEMTKSHFLLSPAVNLPLETLARPPGSQFLESEEATHGRITVEIIDHKDCYASRTQHHPNPLTGLL